MRGRSFTPIGCALARKNHRASGGMWAEGLIFLEFLVLLGQAKSTKKSSHLSTKHLTISVNGAAIQTNGAATDTNGAAADTNGAATDTNGTATDTSPVAIPFPRCA